MSTLASLLSAVRRLHDRTPELAAFAPWPSDLSPKDIHSNACPASRTLGTRALRATRATAPVIKALRRAAPDLSWRQTYTEAEVGAAFLQDYGYVELFGPKGHFQSTKLRGFIGFWGPNLTYDWHDHEAEELYFPLAGQAVFSARGASNVVLKPGQTRRHLTHQSHMMITLDQPFVSYVLWRGAGLDGTPMMTKP